MTRSRLQAVDVLGDYPCRTVVDLRGRFEGGGLMPATATVRPGRIRTAAKFPVVATPEGVYRNPIAGTWKLCVYATTTKETWPLRL